MKRILSIIIIGLLLGCGFGVQGLFFEKPTENTTTIDLGDIFFDKKIELFMRLSKFPSLSACIIDGDTVIWSKGYGFYNLENKKQATENTIYNIASITKTITGTALMQLWEQGLFNLDEDVNNFLPFSLRNPNFPDDPITFRMLLSHSSSLDMDPASYYWLNFSADPPFENYPYPWLKEQLIPGGQWYQSNRWSSTYRPGENNIYANINFDLVCYLVELISGEIFVDYCKNHIFNPLEMHNTSFNLSELNIENVAIPYHYHNGKYIQINELSYMLGESTPPDKYWRMHMYPVGGLYTTVSDLSHFFIAHMNGGVWNGNRILDDDTLTEMHRIQPPGNIFYMYKLGLAWITMEDPLSPLPFNVTLSGHGGGLYGVNSWMFYMPSENIGVIYFNNGDKNYEQNIRLPVISSLIMSLLLYKKGGFNLFSYIEFRNIGG